MRYVILSSCCVGKISVTNLKHREVHLVTVPLSRVFWILFEGVRGFSSGLDMRTDVQYSGPERLLTKLFPVHWGVTTIVSNTSAYRNQYPNTHTTLSIHVLGSPLCFRIDLEHLLTSEISFWLLIFKMGRDSAVGIATRYATDGPGTESRWGGENYRTRPDWPWGLSILLYNGYRVFPAGKAAGAWRWPPTPSCAKVKGRVELYLYSHSGPSWPVLGWTLPLPLPLPLIFKSAAAGNKGKEKHFPSLTALCNLNILFFYYYYHYILFRVVAAESDEEYSLHSHI